VQRKAIYECNSPRGTVGVTPMEDVAKTDAVVKQFYGAQYFVLPGMTRLVALSVAGGLSGRVMKAGLLSLLSVGRVRIQDRIRCTWDGVSHSKELRRGGSMLPCRLGY
jgi:hypothetical protein